MKASYLVASLQIVLMFFLEKGMSLSCYQCNSYEKDRCSGDVTQYDSEFLKPCKENATACRKLEQEVYYDDDYHTRIIRQCSYELDAEMRCIDRTGTYRFKVSYCHCEDDKCNAGYQVATSVSVIAATLGLVGFITKYL